MIATPTNIKNNAFPSHPIKKQYTQKYSNIRYSNHKENTTPKYTRINPEELIREDIMKKFKLRESVRQNKKEMKINNFLRNTMSKMTATPIFFRKKEEKNKVTLTNLLS